MYVYFVSSLMNINKIKTIEFLFVIKKSFFKTIISKKKFNFCFIFITNIYVISLYYCKYICYITVIFDIFNIHSSYTCIHCYIFTTFMLLHIH